MNEKRIAQMMKSLEISREEAIELIKEDEEIDSMTSSKEIDSDLTDAQKKASKDARKATSATKVYTFDTSKRKRKENPQKQELIKVLTKAIEDYGGEVVEITNKEREFSFKFDDVGYKVVMSVPRVKEN